MSLPNETLPSGGAELAALLESCARDGQAGVAAVLPWTELLGPGEQARLKGEIVHLLAEPEATGEPLDWAEIFDLLNEYAELAAWEGPLVPDLSLGSTGDLYRIDIRPQEERLLARAAPAVQRAARELLTGFLAATPTRPECLARGQMKKLPDRQIWQIDLPDGYRLRYFVDELERIVYVVYLGPHPDGDADGRERSVIGRVQRRRSGEALG